jgi:TolB-like protein/Flp pilus assembly protein TadD/predicted Ser/Thr protein kinase
MTVTKACGKCGAKLFAGEKFCNACLLETVLGPLPEDDVELEGAGKRLTPIGTEFGDYQLLEEIGRGGQGVVYRARQKSLNRTVALKVIGVGRWATETHLRRFRLEAEAAARLNHPSIVPIHEICERDGYCYFSMNLIEGGQLDEVLAREAIPIRRAVELVAKLARTVHYAHEHGILHRDIKPGNILIDAEGEPHLTDFGLARLIETENSVTRTTEMLGTPSYMAPEQVGGTSAKLTNATDVYGLGAVLYQLLTGHPPFAGGTTYETIKLLLDTEPRAPRLWNPKVDRDLSTICLKCLEKHPTRRYSSALALAEDLERWLKHQPIQARRIGVISRGKKWLQRNPTVAAVGTLSIALIAAVGVIVWKTDLLRRPAAAGIAVLPFENLSNDKEDASFADGVQDDVLTKLAKIADLKVISRTSVMGYRNLQNTRQIGNELGVSHVLEGSVRKTGAWLHINAQLIDARTDSHVWAEEYDRDLKGMFAMQSEIAQKVAERLHVKISAAERLAIERAPTADLTAFYLYNRAKSLLSTPNLTFGRGSKLLKATDLLNQAIAHDPTFFEAYCQLAWAHDLLHFFGLDRTPQRLALSEAAIQAAFRLRPDAGEIHLARAEHLYLGYLNYNSALAELETARQTLPNNSRLFELQGYIERRRPGGNQEMALRNLERAIELDPRNTFLLRQAAFSYDDLRRYAEEDTALDRALAIEPDNNSWRVARARVDYDSKADTRRYHQVINEIRAKSPDHIKNSANNWLVCALAERDPAAAADALAVLGENGFGSETLIYSKRFVEGLVARMTHEDAKGRAAFTAARAEQDKLVHAHPDDAGALCVLGLIDAALGRKEEALSEGQRAVELLPVEKDVTNGKRMIMSLARIAAWVGDKDLACQQLAVGIQLPSELSYGELKLQPWWDPLRGDPCFEKIVSSLAPNSSTD